MNISELLAASPVVPLVQADDPRIAVDISRALEAGGLRVIEVVLRTDRALDCLGEIASELPGVIAGAGTVLNATQANAALDKGAEFLVSPGLDDGVVGVAKDRDVPVYPGTMTPTEVMKAMNLGLDTVKFFPASIAGGAPALKALASVFRSMHFMPTGGIGPGNLAEYLAIPSVIACGGSWLTPADKIEVGDFDAVTSLATEAVAIARKARG